MCQALEVGAKARVLDATGNLLGTGAVDAACLALPSLVSTTPHERRQPLAHDLKPMHLHLAAALVGPF